MATGVLAALGNSASVTYTAPCPARLQVQWAGTSTNLTMAFNSGTAVAVATGLSTTPSGLIVIFVGKGQSITVATGAALTAVVSVLEEQGP